MKILTVPHKALYRQAKPVEVFGHRLQALIDRMFATMYQHRGIGLAANQVGIPRQIIVLNVGHCPMVLINPEVYSLSNVRVSLTESCLSIPGFVISIERPKSIYVTSLNQYGQNRELGATGRLAQCIQHEVDHLHGILINSKRG